MTNRGRMRPGSGPDDQWLAATIRRELGASRGFSRRSFLRGAGISAAALGGASLLSSCGTEGAKIASGECTSTDLSSQEKSIVFSNWIGYLDPINKPDTSTMEKFEQETGIKVDYRNGDVNANDTFFAKVSPQLQDCKSTGRDVFVVTDWMAARMVELGWLQKLDHDNMPNVDANIIDLLRSPDYDPKRLYSVPWQSGMTGICYNSELTDPVRSYEELLTRPDLKGKIELNTEMRDTMGLMLLLQGSDPGDFTDDEFASAIDALQGYVDSGQIRRFAGNDYVDDMKSGDIVAAQAWSGDVINLLGGDPYKYVPPSEGFMVWTDNMVVPNKATHKTNVEKMMNFYYDPVNAAKLAAWNYYLCPVKGAQDKIAQFDKSAVHSPFIFPDAKTMANGHSFMSVSTDKDQELQRQFNEVMSG
jgi:spermidine/putrescine transport system substrate-binding protein